MSLTAELFGSDSFIHKATNIMGLGVPGWLDRTFGTGDPAAQVNALGEIGQQTAKEGDSRVIVWGRVRPIGGNIIYAQTPVTRWIETEQDSPGKGGKKKKKQKVLTQHVYRTYAIGVSEGPITKFSRIWKNGSLVYDARGNDWGAKNNSAFLKNVRLYLGGWDQMPAPALQAIWGASNVPAHRGTAYIVVIDEDLTPLQGAIPQFQFEVERAEGIAVTSRPYKMEVTENLSGDPSISQLFLKDQVITAPMQLDYVNIAPSVDILALNDESPKPVEFMAIAPGVFKLALPPEVSPPNEYMAIAPGAFRLDPSITYDRQLFEGVALTPSCTELTLA